MKRMELFQKNMRLVYYVVNKMTSHHDIGRSYSGYEKDDLNQIGMIGLWKACQRFDENLGVKFSTYAVPTIQGEIANSMRVGAGSIKVPRESKVITKVISKRKEADIDYSPSIEEIVEEFDCSEDTARIALEMQDISFLSLDAPAKEMQSEKTTLMDIIEADLYETRMADMVINNVALQEKLNLLDEREKTIVLLSMNEMTQREIAEKFGISQVQVSRILKRAINKMKDELEVAV